MPCSKRRSLYRSPGCRRVAKSAWRRESRLPCPFRRGRQARSRLPALERVRWQEVDLKAGLVEWGADEENARKSDAALHVVPLLRPVWTLLREAWIEQGRPAGDQLVSPPINKTKTGLLSMDGLADRAIKAWEKKLHAPDARRARACAQAARCVDPGRDRQGC